MKLSVYVVAISITAVFGFPVTAAASVPAAPAKQPSEIVVPKKSDTSIADNADQLAGGPFCVANACAPRLIKRQEGLKKSVASYNMNYRGSTWGRFWNMW